jgi:hypothetical protein
MVDASGADFEAKAAEYLRQVVEHEARAATMTNTKLRAGFLDLARMCRDLAAQMERQQQLMKQRRAPTCRCTRKPI